MATKNLTRLSEALQTMSNPSRLRILEILHAKGETCVCELEAALGLSESNISFHLNLLRKTGLVSSQKVGKWAFYTLEAEVLCGLSGAALRSLRPGACGEESRAQVRLRSLPNGRTLPGEDPGGLVLLSSREIGERREGGRPSRFTYRYL